MYNFLEDNPLHLLYIYYPTLYREMKYIYFNVLFLLRSRHSIDLVHCSLFAGTSEFAYILEAVVGLPSKSWVAVKRLG
jgi:hypothetical protein